MKAFYSSYLYIVVIILFAANTNIINANEVEKNTIFNSINKTIKINYFIVDKEVNEKEPIVHQLSLVIPKENFYLFTHNKLGKFLVNHNCLDEEKIINTSVYASINDISKDGNCLLEVWKHKNPINVSNYTFNLAWTLADIGASCDFDGIVNSLAIDNPRIIDAVGNSNMSAAIIQTITLSLISTKDNRADGIQILQNRLNALTFNYSEG
ncbi:MAG: hypothetical protein H6553_12575 [Chitinophagales bacterium]|nr:hypothetical protein [Chitinophagales bacterium]